MALRGRNAVAASQEAAKTSKNLQALAPPAGLA